MATIINTTKPDDIYDRNWDISNNNRPCYILDLVTGNHLAIQYVPDEFKYSPDSDWAVIKPFGRNNPFYHYTGSEDCLKFSLHWVAATKNKQDVILRCKWVESLSKSDGYDSDPHACKFILGDLFKSSTWIVKSAPYTLSLLDATNNMMPTLAIQEIELCRITSTNRTRRDILNPYT